MSDAGDAAAQILSVLVINWNGAHFLTRCFQSLREQTLRRVQVILVDNGSTDQSVPLTERDFPEVEIIALGENLGYAEANNRAAAVARGKYLLFLNNDTHVDPHALETFVDAAEDDPRAHIWAPQQRTYDGIHSLHIGMRADVLSYPCGGKKTFYCDGAALFIRKDIFERLGGFDRYYFMWWEDSDLCWRAWLAGYQIRTLPHVLVYHKLGGTAGSSLPDKDGYVTSRRKRRLAHRNQLATLLKNYSTPALCVMLPLFTLLTVGEMLLLVLTGQRSVIKEVYLSAWYDLLRHRSYLRVMRKEVQGMRAVSDWSVLRHMEWKLATVALLFRIGMPRIK